MNDNCKILKENKKIAVVGISRNISRTSTSIAHYLKRNGFEVVGVNPNKSFVNSGEIIVYNNLKDIPHKIDIINVFRKSEDIPSLVDDILNVSPKVLWLQLGIRNDSAVEPVKKAGIKVVQDTCIMVEHSYCF